HAPYIARLDHPQLQFSGTTGPTFQPSKSGSWSAAHIADIRKPSRTWFNPAYLSLMKEKGAEAQSRIQDIIGVSGSSAPAFVYSAPARFVSTTTRAKQRSRNGIHGKFGISAGPISTIHFRIELNG